MPDEPAHTQEEDLNEPDTTMVEIHWGDDSHLTTLFANQLFITDSITGQESYLVFGELRPPIKALTNPEEPFEKQDISPVARLVVPHRAVAQFVKALNESMSEWDEDEGFGGETKIQ
ncbi:MAG: hypothetical protein M1305_06120 [Candidatus Marsarchaeota archaeon]|nr:hypothetical protein [Candidatus Marsarchaeota archaeon]